MDTFYEVMLTLALCISFMAGVLIGMVGYGIIHDRSRRAYKDQL